nr:MAG TPA: hypothetical protein [Caudoviricetes sp.]
MFNQYFKFVSRYQIKDSFSIGCFFYYFIFEKP